MFSLLQHISVVTPECVLMLNAYLCRPKKKAVYHYRDKMQCMLSNKAVLQGRNTVYISENISVYISVYKI